MISHNFYMILVSYRHLVAKYVSTPRPETVESWAFVQPLAMVKLLRARGSLEAPLDNAIGAWCLHGASGALSLSLSLSAEEGRCLPLAV